MFGPYKSSLRVRLRNLIESVRAALNPVTPPRDDAVASGRPGVLCRSSQPAGKICQPVPDGSQVPLPLRCWSGRPRPTARRWSAPRCTRRSRPAERQGLFSDLARSGWRFGAPGVEPGVGGESTTSSSILACARACRWRGDRDVRVRCMSRSASSRDPGALRAPLVCGFLSRAFGGWLLGLFKGVGDGFFQVHRLSLFPYGLVCRFVQRLGC